MRDKNDRFFISRQQENLRKAGDREFDFGLIVPETFVRGIRSIGYKSNVQALAELIDNSIQAYAE